MRHFVNKPAFLLALVIFIAACGSSTSPATDPPAGSYTATSFMTSGTGGQRNELLAGGSLQLNLNPDHTTTGHLHVAASSSSPVLDADMAGTWTVNGNVVTISQTADTFVRDMQFTLSLDPATGYVLVGNRIFSGTQIQVTLSRISYPYLPS
ncbi:MAG: hypothetical protein ACR2NS_00425 [Gemmatimonadaceae bacterium]